jgi:hypothetical protein
MTTGRERLRTEAPGEYLTQDRRYLISRADNGSWYLFETQRIGGDSIFFGPTLRSVRDRLSRLRRRCTLQPCIDGRADDCTGIASAYAGRCGPCDMGLTEAEELANDVRHYGW